MDQILANKLLDKISNLTEYNISIIDESGKVLASKIKEHIGVFHEIGFEIMKGTMDSITVEISNPEIGVKEGMYLAVYLNKHKVGVVGINGDPHNIRPVAEMIRFSIETMLEFETYKNNHMRKYTAKERFMRTILYNDDFDRQTLEAIFSETGLKQDIIRVPVLIQLSHPAVHLSAAAEQLRNSSLFQREDFLEITNESCIFLLKSIYCDKKNMMQDYKYLLGEYLSCVLNYARNADLEQRIYVGPIQNDIIQYRQAYLYCRWMQHNINKPGSHYFYDYIVKYLESMASQNEYNAIFSYFKQELGQKFIDNYIEITSALIEKDFNLTKASELLHIHKNTLIYRLDKIREVLNMNPLSNNSEREFMECFYFYLVRNKSAANWTV